MWLTGANGDRSVPTARDPRRAGRPGQTSGPVPPGQSSGRTRCCSKSGRRLSVESTHHSPTPASHADPVLTRRRRGRRRTAVASGRPVLGGTGGQRRTAAARQLVAARVQNGESGGSGRSRGPTATPAPGKRHHGPDADGDADGALQDEIVMRRRAEGDQP